MRWLWRNRQAQLFTELVNTAVLIGNAVVLGSQGMLRLAILACAMFLCCGIGRGK
jgi:hypothetical protein